MAFLATIEAKIIGGLLIAAIVGGVIYWTYDEGRDAGASAITGAVQTKTIETLDAARTSKEKADEEVRRTPYDGRVDGLR